METGALIELDEQIEKGYVGLARLARGVCAAADFRSLAVAVAGALHDPFAPATVGVRLWATGPEGVEEVVRHPLDGDFPPLAQRELRGALRADEPTEASRGRLLSALRWAGADVGVLELDEQLVDRELLGHAAAIVACGFGGLIAQRDGGPPSAPGADAARDAAALMAAFACEAKRLLEHDRLSAYLLTGDGRAFERFAVATSPTLPGEGVVIPFEDVGLRHVVMTNRPLVSRDLASDPRIVGREDRVIAAAGFHGLISVPLRLDGRPFGVLNFVSREPGFYGDEDLPIAQQIADQVSAFIDNLRTQERTRTQIRHQAVEWERVRIARDVSHAVTQTLGEIDAIAEQLRQRSGDGDPVARDGAARVRALVALELADVRRALADLAPRGLDAHTLSQAITAGVARWRERSPQSTLTIRGDSARLSRAARHTAFRIFQEALANARLHAGPCTVHVTLQIERDLTLTVADDGVGFDVDAVDGSGGTGLQAMRERARAIGGILSVDSAPHAGTKITFRLLGGGEGPELAPGGQEPASAAAPERPRLRVFVVEPTEIVRAGLVATLEREGDIRVVGQAASGEEARSQLVRLHPDVVLLDVQAGESNATRTICELRARLPACALLLLEDHGTGRERALIDAGASGIVPTTIGAAELNYKVRAVAGGATLGDLPGPASRRDGCGLTSREREVLVLLTSGLTNAEIGGKLYLATKTVERQVATVIHKLGARNRAHAGAVAIARRLVEPAELGE
ncbi:MAG TPA: GAF domain-containing protein [Conexibacter sp.]